MASSSFTIATFCYCTCIAILFMAALTHAAPRRRQNCLRSCPMTFDPICDNQGTTHPNLCTMQYVACRRRMTLQQAYKGICQPKPTESKPSESTTTQTKSLMGRIISLISGRPEEHQKQCLYVCPLNYQPVCGSDHRTYPNECTMRSRACRQNTRLTIAHQGPCNFWNR